jgi:hypothetical protein
MAHCYWSKRKLPHLQDMTRDTHTMMGTQGRAQVILTSSIFEQYEPWTISLLNLRSTWACCAVIRLAKIFGLENQIHTKPNNNIFQSTTFSDCLPLSADLSCAAWKISVENFTRERQQSMEAPDCIPAPLPIMVINYAVWCLYLLWQLQVFVWLNYLVRCACLPAFPWAGRAPWQENTKVVFISHSFCRFFSRPHGVFCASFWAYLKSNLKCLATFTYTG